MDSPAVSCFNGIDSSKADIFQKGGFGDSQIFDGLLGCEDHVLVHRSHKIVSIFVGFNQFDCEICAKK